MVLELIPKSVYDARVISVVQVRMVYVVVSVFVLSCSR